MARAKEYSVESMGVSPDKVHLAWVTVWLTRCACASLAMRLWLLGSVGIGLLGRVGIGRYISLRGEDVQVEEDRGELGGEEVQHEHAAPAVDSAVRPHDEREQVVRPHQTRVGPAHLGGQLVAMPPQDDAVGSEEAARNTASDQTKRRQPLRKQAGLGRRARRAGSGRGTAQAYPRPAQEQAAERGQRARRRSHGVEQVLGAADIGGIGGTRQWAVGGGQLPMGIGAYGM